MKPLSKFLFAAVLAAPVLVSCGKAETLSPLSEVTTETNIYSHTVTQQKAEAQLMDLLSRIEGPATRADGTTGPRKIVSRYSTGSPIPTKVQGEVEPFVHIFNFENEGGFALMSGDDRVEPLLALTYKGELSPHKEVTHPGLIMFLANMETAYLDYFPEPGGPGFKFPEVREEYGPWVDSVFTMRYGNCMVHWGQENPYNMYCPVVGGSTAPTGCVATAVAQLMSIYEHPTTFNWTEMKKHISTNSLECYPPAYPMIANLMSLLGLPQNLDMEYGIGASGALPENIPHTLENMGYTNGGVLAPYNYRAVYQELSQGYPVLVGGSQFRELKKKWVLGIPVGTYYDHSGSHRWLIHGLMERSRMISTYHAETGELLDVSRLVSWYPLCNFGANGRFDGYYLDRAFDVYSPYQLWHAQIPPTRAIEGRSGYFQYEITTVMGIRK